MKFLLEAKADTSIPEKDGYTPMHGAGFQGRAEIAKLLIAHGLNPSDRHKAPPGCVEMFCQKDIGLELGMSGGKSYSIAFKSQWSFFFRMSTKMDPAPEL